MSLRWLQVKRLQGVFCHAPLPDSRLKQGFNLHVKYTVNCPLYSMQVDCKLKDCEVFCAKMGGVDSGRTPAGRVGCKVEKRNLTLGSVNKELQFLALTTTSSIH